MTGLIYGADGAQHQLPVFLEYTITRTDGEPCDSFQVRFVYEPTQAEVLRTACRFSAAHDGRTVFTGVVDEFEVTASSAGRVCVLSGRGLGALLRDNQTRAVSFVSAQLTDVLQRFVSGLGIPRIDADALPAVANYSVPSGTSCYQALAGYCRHAADITPRFLADGTLQLRAAPPAARHEITASTAIDRAVWRVCRYGVISEQILVRSRTGVATATENTAFQTVGGCCRRVNLQSNGARLPSDYSAAARIAESMREYNVLTLTMPGQFLAEPGDRVSVRVPVIGVAGDFTVRAVTSTLDRSGAQCVLELV